MEMKAVLVLRLIIGVVVAIALFVAGQEMMRAGRFMDIQSIGGQTLEEAFYQAYGMFAQALGIASMALAGLALVVAVPTTWPPATQQPSRAAIASQSQPAPGSAQPSAAAARPPDDRQCSRCGYALPNDADYCPQCGYQQEGR
jgi:hypothetical protein